MDFDKRLTKTFNNDTPTQTKTQSQGVCPKHGVVVMPHACSGGTEYVHINSSLYGGV